jgi:ATP-dependent helicase HrpA
MNPDRSAAAAERLNARRAASLTFRFDPALPITARRAEILEALRAHQVLIVAGETGSGKSTQLPQYCLEIGRGIDGLIAHTQPRRIAARALAARIAEELSQSVGDTVGFRVRFADQVSGGSRLVLMTDGLLLAELNSDPALRRYDTVIVDEAHERSLNVDLLLGVLKRLIARRPELKVIVTSATLDVERMSDFFGGAPIVTVSGRSHPIEVRYSTSAELDEEPDLPTAVLQACREIEAEPAPIGRGDVLVFLPGEREIADVGELLERELQRDADVIPLYSRLAWDQQSKVFQPGARRRVVLATNVAETSITVPGIRAVIDSGLARVSRYSARNRLQRLPIEPVSRASADQRKGRCGRLGPGLCIRLYDEAQFEERDAFTEPEVLRTNLAALLLRLAADALGAAEDFPFIDPPDGRALNDGYRLLQELGALDEARRITRRGRAMARLPLDPRLSRSLLESKRFHAEEELLAIVSGLSVPDARITAPGAPIEEGAETAGFEDTKSEFSALAKLWRAYQKAREGSRRELRRWCKERRLSLLRLSEWDNVYGQVRVVAAELGVVAGPQGASYTAVHRSLLAGFCTMIGARGEEGVYLGTRGVKFHIFPGSPLKRRKPAWIMAANIVETSRVYGRRLAEIQPAWIESAAEQLLKREYLEPDWNEAREEVVARERTTLLGLVLHADRTVNYGPIAPEQARQIFAREALVYQRLSRRPDWLLANDAALAAARRVEERLRTRDLVIDAESLVDFYVNALPRQVSSAATLEHFSRHLGEAERRALTLEAASLFARAPDPQALIQFPERVELSRDAAAPGRSLEAAVEYRFAPGEAQDGATIMLPLLALPLLTRATLDAAVPGFARPRIEALLRTLPKEARRRLIPISDAVTRFLQSDVQRAADMESLAQWLTTAEALPAMLVRFDASALEPHLTPQLAVIDDGRVIARGVDLAALRLATATRARAALDRLARAAYPGAWARFEVQELAASELLAIPGGSIEVFAGLTRNGNLLQVGWHWTRAEADRCMLDGAIALARRQLERQARDLGKRIAENAPLLLVASPFLRSETLVDLLVQLSFRRACFDTAPPPRTRSGFEQALEQSRERLFDTLTALCAQASAWFTEARAVRRLLDDPRAKSLAALARESHAHLGRLLDAGSLVAMPDEQLGQIVRYLRAEERRWQRMLVRGSESPAIARELAVWSARCESLQQRSQAELRWLPQLQDLGTWIEEYRVSLYAQELKTQRPVSAARLQERAAALEAWFKR